MMISAASLTIYLYIKDFDIYDSKFYGNKISINIQHQLKKDFFNFYQIDIQHKYSYDSLDYCYIYHLVDFIC